MYITGDNETVLIDIGSITYKIGYTNIETPSFYNISKGVKNSIINNLQSYLDIITTTIPVDTSYLLISENTFEDPNTKKKILEHVFENNLCDSLMFSKSCILDLMSYGKTTGIVVSISGGSTQVSSVIDGYVVRKEVIFKGLGDVMDKYYSKEVCRGGSVVGGGVGGSIEGLNSGSIESGGKVVEEGGSVESRSGPVGEGTKSDNEQPRPSKNEQLQNNINSQNNISSQTSTNIHNNIHNNNPHIPTLPYNKLIQYKHTLLEQSYLDLKKPTTDLIKTTTLKNQFKSTHTFLYNIPSLITDVLNEIPQDKHQHLLNNIVISGYGSYIPTIYFQEILGDYKFNNISSRFHNISSRFHTFSGGCILSNIGSVKSLHIGRLDYKEYGCNIFNKKNHEWGV